MAKGPARNSPALGREIPREKGVGNGAISALTPCIFKTAFWILLGGKKMGEKKRRKIKGKKKKKNHPLRARKEKKMARDLQECSLKYRSSECRAFFSHLNREFQCFLPDF